MLVLVSSLFPVVTGAAVTKVVGIVPPVVNSDAFQPGTPDGTWALLVHPYRG